MRIWKIDPWELTTNLIKDFFLTTLLFLVTAPAPGQNLSFLRDDLRASFRSSLCTDILPLLQKPEIAILLGSDFTTSVFWTIRDYY